MDQNNQQPPPQPVQIVVSTAPVPVKLTFGQKFVGFFRYLFGEGRIILLLIAAGVAILEFGNSMMGSILKKDKKLVDDTQKKSDELKSQEDAASQQADALVKHAAELPSQEQPVKDDWYKNEKK
jgi:hypothetical protein